MAESSDERLGPGPRRLMEQNFGKIRGNEPWHARLARVRTKLPAGRSHNPAGRGDRRIV